jgi:hypothetical protein
MTPKMLFFCRGRGRGHAVPDLVIADEMRRLAPELVPCFVSYGTGADTLAEAGAHVIDLELRDDAPFFEVLVRAGLVIGHERPDVVVAHEEFAALPAAKACNVPTVFIVDFFLPTPDHPWMQCLPYADELLFIERRGLFPEPPGLRCRVSYLGPIVRPMSRTRADRASAREELALSPAATVVSVIPGSWATEDRAPLAPLVHDAFASLPQRDKVLVWVAGQDFTRLSTRFGGASDVRVVEHYSPIETLMVASDVVITKANRGTTLELAQLGIPSVAVSYGLNMVDDTIVARIPSTVALHAKGIDAAYLRDVLTTTLAAPPPATPPSGGAESSVARSLVRIAQSHAAQRRPAECLPGPSER